MQRWGALLARFVQSTVEQDALLLALQSACASNPLLADIFEGVLNALYDCDDDICPEEAILRCVDWPPIQLDRPSKL